jgi:ADP-heptose:LPS heptosyltransferase
VVVQRILVIKLGALGDFIHAFHAFAAIRARHRGSQVTLLTTAPFAELARASPWFDAVLTDPRAPWWNLAALRRIARTIGGFDFVYDLQTSRRSNRYFRWAGRPPWSGIAAGSSHPHANPARDAMHTIERQREQLAAAGVTEFPVPERGWLTARGHRHGLAEPYAMLMPGGAGVGDVKRWPVDRFAAMAGWLSARGVTPAVIGGQSEVALAKAILTACPGVDLTRQTSIEDIAALAGHATLVLGNDTGPVHLAAAAGAPTIVLFSAAGVPDQAAPRGPAGEWTTILRSPVLADLAVERVQEAAAKMLDLD